MWKFPRAFWTANAVELFERAAYYAMFIAVTLYLTNTVGFSDFDAAMISGAFSAGLFCLIKSHVRELHQILHAVYGTPGKSRASDAHAYRLFRIASQEQRHFLANAACHKSCSSGIRFR